MPDTYPYKDIVHFLINGKLPDHTRDWGYQKRRNFLSRDSKKYAWEAKKINSTSSVMALFIKKKLITPSGKKEYRWLELPPPEDREGIIFNFHHKTGHSSVDLLRESIEEVKELIY